MPDLYEKPRREDCLAWDGDAHRIVCPNDQCGESDTTLCGLAWGIDFDEDEVDNESGEG